MIGRIQQTNYRASGFAQKLIEPMIEQVFKIVEIFLIHLLAPNANSATDQLVEFKDPTS